NWYDTRSLEPLQPTYISTVDSANLAGCLLTLKQGLMEKAREPLLGLWVVSGLTDTFHVIEEAWHSLGAVTGEEAARKRSKLEDSLKALEGALGQTPSDLPAWAKWLLDLKGCTAALSDGVRRLSESASPFAGELDLWTRRFSATIEKYIREL